MISLKPALNASEDVWYQYAKVSCLYLESKLPSFLTNQFGYKTNKVIQHLCLGLGATVKADTPKYDLYFRMFPIPETGWPRETIVLARIGFKDVRVGHGRSLLKFITKLASEIGYQYIAIESANENSSAFGRRFGLQPMNERESKWIGSVDDVQRALEHSV